jgi:lipopolysaccharide biosynthesis glycosyltransferase
MAESSEKAEDVSSCFVADERNKARCVDPQSMQAPNDALHVVYSADVRMIKGLQASMSSAITSASDPAQLVFHVLVQAERKPDFAKAFGLPEDCSATVTPKGTQIQFVGFEEKDLHNTVAAISQGIRSERGALDSVENFARFYMHRLVPGVEVAIYLDADTIVQRDLRHLRTTLLTSNKTVGFVARPEWDHATMRGQLNLSAGTWSTELLDTTAYNAGVFAVNLKRWAEHGISERIDKLVHRHNECGGKLWLGGSQPPMLLAFF